jgi:NADPH-dependent curcumin reductase CurA
LAPIGPGQALVRTLWLSLDPANRIWMSELHKARGARVVGIAGSREKCRHVVEALGFDYLAGLINEGKLNYDETVVEGLEHARSALNQMFGGANTGKLLIKVAEPL